MIKFERILFSVSVSISISLLPGCGQKGQSKIERLAFLDTVHPVFMVIDTNHINPISQKNIFYLVNESTIESSSDEKIKHFLDSSRFVAETLQSYPAVEILFYKNSENIQRLIMTKDRKLLNKCSNDIIWEFVYDDGKMYSAFKFNEGIIIDP